jgi:2-oxo-3-hexenedioate decarboxylase
MDRRDRDLAQAEGNTVSTDAAERNPAIDAWADRLFAALKSGTPIAPLSSDPAFDVAAGYAVLQRLHARRRAEGDRPLGRKIGFTNRTLWARYGVDRPMWSHVWEESVLFARDGEATVPLAGLLEPRIEPEIVFRLAAPLSDDGDPERVLQAVEWIAPGFEIVQSVFPGWKFGTPDCTAAFGLHGRLVVGTPVALDAENRRVFAQRLTTFELALRRGDEVIDRGTGANVLDSPVNALSHLRALVAAQPDSPPLAAGEIITTGTVTDAWPVAPGQRWSSDCGELGLAPLSVRFV